MENVSLFKTPTNGVKPPNQTFDKRNRPESDPQIPDRKIVMMNFDPAKQH
jgi:hypothetical protein